MACIVCQTRDPLHISGNAVRCPDVASCVNRAIGVHEAEMDECLMRFYDGRDFGHYAGRWREIRDVRDYLVAVRDQTKPQPRNL
jgi:hypothetical protein